MTKNKAEQLLKKYIAGTCSPEEKRLLESFYIHESAKSELFPDFDMLHTRKAALWQGTLDAIQAHQTNRNRRYRLRWQLAAAIMLIAGGSWLYMLNFHPSSDASRSPKDIHVANKADATILKLSDGSEIVLDDAKNGTLAVQGNTLIIKKDNGTLSYSNPAGGSGESVAEVLLNTMTTPKGRTYKLTLPDQTTVLLNGGTSITYPTSFTGKERVVSVIGEAYFEVAKDKSMPFIVNSGINKIRVLGTVFNVNAYADEDAVTTTLFEGSVQVWKHQSKTLLSPGQRAVNSKISGEIVVEAADLDAVTAWREGFFYLGNENIVDIMKQVSRWYDIDVEYQGDMSGKSFGGKFERSLGLPELLKCLKKAGGIRYKIQGRRVIIMP